MMVKGIAAKEKSTRDTCPFDSKGILSNIIEHASLPWVRFLEINMLLIS